MKQKTLATIFLYMLAVNLITGCDKEPPKPQAVVINLVAIGEATGISEQMKELTEAMNQKISEEMKALSARLRKEFEDEQDSLGDNPSEEDKQRMLTLREQLKKQLIQARSETHERREKETSAIRQSSIDKIMSVAQVVAGEHSASIILKNMGVFWTDGSVDITDEVVTRMVGSMDTQPADGSGLSEASQEDGESR